MAFSRAALRAGHGALVHATAGGIGLAAVEYAHSLRAGVAGSAGRPHKHGPVSYTHLRAHETLR